MAGPGWVPARLRFLESGRAQQTPAWLCLAGRWLPLELLAERTVAEVDPTRPSRKFFRVRLPDGRPWELAQEANGAWLGRRLPFPPGPGPD